MFTQLAYSCGPLRLRNRGEKSKILVAGRGIAGGKKTFKADGMTI
jgi:hypothetical protein